MATLDPAPPTGEDPSWLSLEKLAARIYSALSPESEVKHDDKILGRHSGELRQIDVSIRTSVAGHGFLTVVDTKDEGRPLTIEDIDEFAALVDDVGANKGVLINRGGFSQKALRYAQRKGLDLCRVHDTANRKWTTDVQIPIYWRERTPVIDFGVTAEFQGGDSWPRDPKEWVIRRDADPSRRILLDSTFATAWNARTIPLTVGPRHHLRDADLGPTSILVENGGTMAWRTVNEIRLSYVVTEQVYLGHLEPDEARGIVHADGSFFAESFGLSALPIKRNPAWPEVDPASLPIRVAGTVIESIGWQVVPGSMQSELLRVVRVEDGQESPIEFDVDAES